jgi:hypothetical protein
MGNKLRTASGPFILSSIPAPVCLDTYPQIPQTSIHLLAHLTSLNFKLYEIKVGENVSSISGLFILSSIPAFVGLHTYPWKA